MAQVEYNKYLPPYRSLLTPNAKYDYRTHLRVELTLLDLQRIESQFHIETPPQKTRNLKMKYRSLLDDVSRKALIISLRVQLNLHGQPNTLKATKQLWSRCKTFSQLPLELQIHVFSFVEDPLAYYSSLFVCQRFYQLAKPFLYRNVTFVSTYRFAQFVTILRINPSLGLFVEEIDLSLIRPGNWRVEAEQEASEEKDTNMDRVLAGWRDWKFKTSPLYAAHVAPCLVKTVSNVSIALHLSQKKMNLSRYFKKRRRSSVSVYPPVPEHPHHLPTTVPSSNGGSHPAINKFLFNYSSFKDVPVGYVLHLINLCPNLSRANLSSLSLLTDYRIVPKTVYKYQPYDLMHNYHKDLRRVIESILPLSLQTSFNPFASSEAGSFHTGSIREAASSVSSVFSLNFSKPIRKYNSLLPPLLNPTTEMLYFSRADGVIFLSDLNVKAISTSDLSIVPESCILDCLARRSYVLQELYMSSMIWINVKMVKSFLEKMFEKDLVHNSGRNEDRILFQGVDYRVGAKLEDVKMHASELKLRLLDLTDSGMSKNSDWAHKIDTGTPYGQRLVQRIVNDELISPRDEFIVQERIRRGPIGENYFS